jgi:DNA repair photolyase
MHDIFAKYILSASNGMNLCRGCTHGCIYCDSRSRCYQMDHAFEDVALKVNAPELLDEALRRKRKKCMIATGSMSDPYIPIEKSLSLTRRCFEIIRDRGLGLTLITKSAMVLRDIDLLDEINRRARCVVQMTLTTFDEKLCRIIEPNVSTSAERFEALKVLRDRGIPTVVWLSPILPFISDTEENIRGLLEYCVEAKVKGIICFGIGLTLREGNREYFYAALDRHFPGLKQTYIEHYGNAYEIPSPRDEKLMRIFRGVCSEHDIMHDPQQCFAYLREFKNRDESVQRTLPGFE